MDTLESVIHLTYFMFPLSVKQNMPVSQLITEEALMSSSNVDVCTVGEIGDEMNKHRSVLCLRKQICEQI